MCAHGLLYGLYPIGPTVTERTVPLVLINLYESGHL
jgi:hypothetical protein